MRAFTLCHLQAAGIRGIKKDLLRQSRQNHRSRDDSKSGRYLGKECRGEILTQGVRRNETAEGGDSVLSYSCTDEGEKTNNKKGDGDPPQFDLVWPARLPLEEEEYMAVYNCSEI